MLGRLRISALGFLLLLCSVLTCAAAEDGTLQRAAIVDGSVAVQATGYVAYHASVDAAAMQSARIRGHVVASGGTGNDIEVIVFTETQFINWKNSHNDGALFASGKVTACDIDVPVTETGTYYVVLSNAFSAITAKTVTGKIELEWTPPPPPAPTKEEQDAQNSLLLGGAAFVAAVLVIAGGIGGLIVWLVMSRRKQSKGTGAES